MSSIKDQIAAISQLGPELGAKYGFVLTAIRESLQVLEQLEIAGFPINNPKAMIKVLDQVKSIEQFSQFQDFVKAYDDFCRSFSGVGAKMDGAQGAALKKIVAYLIRENKDKDEAGALLAWNYILNNWKNLTKFIQNQVSLTQINKNLPEILTQLRNGATKQAGSKAAVNAVRDRIRRGADQGE